MSTPETSELTPRSTRAESPRHEVAATLAGEEADDERA
jgi:hypothetical protein